MVTIPIDCNLIWQELIKRVFMSSNYTLKQFIALDLEEAIHNE
jgi:hypothetical protein